jgi:hypothetical protein
MRGAVFAALISIVPSCAFPDRGEPVFPSARRELLAGMSNLEGARTIPVDLKLDPENWRAAEKLGVISWLTNNTSVALCVPLVFLNRSNWSRELEIRDAETGRALETLKYHQNRDWPDQRYAILPPGSRFLFVRDVIDLSGLEPGRRYSIKLRLPAFDCNIFDSGYPVSPAFMKSAKAVEAEHLSLPVTEFAIEDVVVFEGEIKEFEM